MKIRINLSSINKILIVAFLLRILVLITILLLKDYMSAYGFIGAGDIYDDYRYETGAILYGKTANGLYDVDTFRRIFEVKNNDWVGYHLDNWFTGTPLWYWIVCDFMYIFKSHFLLRSINIINYVIVIKIVYEFVKILYNEKTALFSARLLADLPYTIIFSCFLYKFVYNKR